MPRLTDLNYLLLGLLARKRQSAYSLAASLASTPMSAYSDSPGTVYPAVRKLVRMGLLVRHPAPASAPGRAPQTLAVTEEGMSVLERWLRQPVTSDDLTRRPGTVVLRLALVSAVLGEDHLPLLLEQLAEEAGAARARLDAFTAQQGRILPLGSRLPLDLAQELLTTYARWATATRQRLV